MALPAADTGAALRSPTVIFAESRLPAARPGVISAVLKRSKAQLSQAADRGDMPLLRDRSQPEVSRVCDHRRGDHRAGVEAMPLPQAAQARFMSASLKTSAPTFPRGRTEGHAPSTATDAAGVEAGQ